MLIRQREYHYYCRDGVTYTIASLYAPTIGYDASRVSTPRKLNIHSRIEAESKSNRSRITIVIAALAFSYSLQQ